MRTNHIKSARLSRRRLRAAKLGMVTVFLLPNLWGLVCFLGVKEAPRHTIRRRLDEPKARTWCEDFAQRWYDWRSPRTLHSFWRIG